MERIQGLGVGAVIYVLRLFIAGLFFGCIGLGIASLYVYVMMVIEGRWKSEK